MDHIDTAESAGPPTGAERPEVAAGGDHPAGLNTISRRTTATRATVVGAAGRSRGRRGEGGR